MIEKQGLEMMPKQSLKTVIWNSLWMNINQIKRNHLVETEAVVENKVNSTNKTALKTKKANKAIKAVKKTLEKINKILEINKRSEIKLKLIVITIIFIKNKLFLV